MTGRRFPAGMSEAIADLPPLPREARRVADVRAENARLRAALVKVRDLAVSGGAAPAVLSLVTKVADEALAGAR